MHDALKYMYDMLNQISDLINLIYFSVQLPSDGAGASLEVSSYDDSIS
jgi:hypothetical protein